MWTRQHGEWIGRATALAVALWLCSSAIGTFRAAEAARTDPVVRAMRDASPNGRTRNGNPVLLLYLVSAGLGTLGVALGTVAVAPKLTVAFLERTRGNPDERETPEPSRYYWPL